MLILYATYSLILLFPREVAKFDLLVCMSHVVCLVCVRVNVLLFAQIYSKAGIFQRLRNQFFSTRVLPSI